ncbi:MAG: FAD-dependent oxidoreductase [Candidatus Paceibacterota bacterium]|jgi:alkyl hydroperoxide reductase subunit AhpF
MYDLIIIGGGPAGIAAGIYAARKKLKTLLLTESLEGQSSVSPEIQNWIGEINISGIDLSKKLESHLRSYESDNFVIKTKEKAISLNPQDKGLTVFSINDTYQTKTVLIATGANRRKLSVQGAAEFEQKGVTYCASCDGPIFAGQKVAIIGGGNAGFCSAAQLLAYCEKVTLLETASNFKAEQITIDNLIANPKFKALANVELLEIKGDKFVTSLVYRDKETDKEYELPVTGIFVEIGFIPNTKNFQDLVETTTWDAIKIDHRTGQTSREGIWAAGDCTDILYHQNNIAAGDAIKAVEDIYNYLQKQS